jgi:uncharacterized protein
MKIFFKAMARQEATNTEQATEVLLSVDEVAKKALVGGGKVFGKPSEIQGWMYGCGFCDLDGHRWNALYTQ